MKKKYALILILLLTPTICHAGIFDLFGKKKTQIAALQNNIDKMQTTFNKALAEIKLQIESNAQGVANAAVSLGLINKTINKTENSIQQLSAGGDINENDTVLMLWTIVGLIIALVVFMIAFIWYIAGVSKGRVTVTNNLIEAIRKDPKLVKNDNE